MKLIFIRHGEPDYITDSLTENGILEAKALAERTKHWNVTEFYVSPQGRAIETARPTLEYFGATAKTMPFLREYSYPIIDPVTARNGVAWDFVPSYWTNIPYMFDLEDGFLQLPCIQKNKDISNNYPEVINGFDKILEEYGYIRKDKYYILKDGRERFIKSTVSDDDKIRNNSPLKPGEKETTLVFFCHLGVTCLILSHLLNIPFESICHGMFLPTTSVTVLSTEERWSNEAYFRAQTIGDCSHIKNAGLKISPAGSFADPFQG